MNLILNSTDGCSKFPHLVTVLRLVTAKEKRRLTYSPSSDPGKKTSLVASSPHKERNLNGRFFKAGKETPFSMKESYKITIKNEPRSKLMPLRRLMTVKCDRED